MELTLPSCCRDRINHTNELKEVGLVLPHGFCMQSVHHGRESMAAGVTAAGHIVSAVKRQRHMAAGVQPAPLSSFHSVWGPAYERGLMPFKGGFFFST